MAIKVVLKGRIEKRNGQVVSSTVTAHPIAGGSQRWGLAARDPRSGRHNRHDCISCQHNFH